MIARLEAIGMFDNNTMKAMVMVCDLNIVAFSSPRAIFLQLLHTNSNMAAAGATRTSESLAGRGTATARDARPSRYSQNEQEMPVMERNRERASLPVAWRYVHDMFFFLELRRFIRMQL